MTFRLIPQTLMGRTILVFVTGFVVVSLVFAAYATFERTTLLSTIGGWHGLERVGEVIKDVEATAPSQRRELVKGVHAPGFRVMWGPNMPIPPQPLSWQGQRIKDALENFVGPIGPDGLRLQLSSVSRPMLHGRDLRDHYDNLHHDEGHMRRLLLVAYKLKDGSWLSFRLIPTPPRFSSFFLLLPAVLAVLGVVGLSIWAVRRATLPLERLAQAAQRLGLDVNAPPMDTKGPYEVRRAAEAFNLMQSRVQAFVRDRTLMLAAVGHDLRTPITRLKLRAEFIDDDEQREKMLSDLDEMEAMIAATLAFARDDFAQEPTVSVDFSEIVKTVCDQAREHGADVSYSADRPIEFDARPVALKRMVSNLVDNAVRYGERARVSVSFGQDPKTIVLLVEDDGPGIDEDMLERVFDPFVRIETSRSRDTGGTGLGLSAVKNIVQAHAGRIELQNRTGGTDGGLCVRVELPMK